MAVRDNLRMALRHQRVYAVFYVPYEADPDQVVQSWLNENGCRSSNQWFGGVQLVTAACLWLISNYLQSIYTRRTLW